MYTLLPSSSTPWRPRGCLSTGWICTRLARTMRPRHMCSMQTGKAENSPHGREKTRANSLFWLLVFLSKEAAENAKPQMFRFFLWFVASEPPTMHLELQRCWCLMSGQNVAKLSNKKNNFWDVLHFRNVRRENAAPFSRSSRVKPRRTQTFCEAAKLRKHWVHHCSSVIGLHHDEVMSRFFKMWLWTLTQSSSNGNMFWLILSFGVGVKATWPFWKDISFSTKTKYWTVCHKQLEPSVISPVFWELFHPLRTFFFHICSISYFSPNFFWNL